MGGVRHVIVGVEHPCRWMVWDVVCTVCAAHVVMTACACVEDVACPDCGHQNLVPVDES